MFELAPYSSQSHVIRHAKRATLVTIRTNIRNRMQSYKSGKTQATHEIAACSNKEREYDAELRKLQTALAETRALRSSFSNALQASSDQLRSKYEPYKSTSKNVVAGLTNYIGNRLVQVGKSRAQLESLVRAMETRKRSIESERAAVQRRRSQASDYYSRCDRSIAAISNDLTLISKRLKQLEAHK